MQQYIPPPALSQILTDLAALVENTTTDNSAGAADLIRRLSEALRCGASLHRIEHEIRSLLGGK